MKYLFYFYSNFNPMFMGMLLDEAIELSKDKNNDVLFVYCGGLCDMCLFNRKGSKRLCKFCSKTTKKILDFYHIKNASLLDYYKDDVKLNFSYKDSQELRSIQYKNAQIGMGILSSYISGTRNLSPAITENTRMFFDAHIIQSVRFVDAFYSLIDEYQPDVVYTFNGRYEEVRPIYDICKSRNIHFYLSEGVPFNGTWRKVMFENNLPHDIRYNKERWNYCWDNYKLSEDEKKQLGRSFFENRKNGIYAGDKIYIKDQIKGKIPLIDDSKVNIAIMNSSEDEFAAVGEEWDSLKVFPNQYEGIIFMLRNAPKNIHFYLRIHPNLKDIKYKYHTDLLKLEDEYCNITVIPGNSEVSTYDLMDRMSKIVVFGSTMGMESVYWGKPVINLGPAIYSYENICYIPDNKEQLIELLSSDLKPLHNDEILKIGAYYMNMEPLFLGDKNINFQIERKKIGAFSYSVVPYISFLMNKEITGLYLAVMRYIYSSKLFCKFNYPLEEE